jgi:hypothetical protein
VSAHEPTDKSPATMMSRDRLDADDVWAHTCTDCPHGGSYIQGGTPGLRAHYLVVHPELTPP